MPKFMLLLHERPGAFKGVSPEEMQGVIEKYSAWARQLSKTGKWAGGEKLKDDYGKNLTKKGEKLNIQDGPYSETKEIIGGYFSIKAKNYEEAVQVASDCPHLGYGGRIEVRQVDEL